jgi:hypothetical protein
MKKSIDKQEEVVSALWDFAHDLQTHNHEARSESFDGKKKTTMNMESIRKAHERIMKNFGYEIIQQY